MRCGAVQVGALDDAIHSVQQRMEVLGLWDTTLFVFQVQPSPVVQPASSTHPCSLLPAQLCLSMLSFASSIHRLPLRSLTRSPSRSAGR